MTASTLCRSCKAPIRMLAHERTGNLAPIEVEPPQDGKGNIVVNLADETYRVLGPAQLAVMGHEGLVVNHFGRCPQAAQWHKA